MDKQKGHLIEAYLRLGCAQADAIIEPAKSPAEPQPHSTAEEEPPKFPPMTIEEVDETYNEMLKWIDATDAKVQQWLQWCFMQYFPKGL